MRHVLIVSPNLTNFRQGAVLSADDLGMDDEQLDAFVDKGFAVHHETAPAAVDAPAEEVVEEVEAEPAGRTRRGRSEPELPVDADHEE